MYMKKLISIAALALACFSAVSCADTPYVSEVSFRIEEGDPVPPNTPVPAELEVCILRAELCMNFCGIDPAAPPVSQVCISKYEDCAYDIPEAHESSCRVSYVWCVLEESATSPEWVHDFCKEVRNTCATNANA